MENTRDQLINHLAWIHQHFDSLGYEDKMKAIAKLRELRDKLNEEEKAP